MIAPQLITLVVLIIVELQYVECNGRDVDSLDIGLDTQKGVKLEKKRDVLIDDLPDKRYDNIILIMRNDRNIAGDLSSKYLPDDRKKYVYYHPNNEHFDANDHSLLHRPDEDINPVYLMRASKKGETGSIVKNETGPPKKLFLPFIAGAGWFLFKSLFYAGVAKGVDEGVNYIIKKNS